MFSNLEPPEGLSSRFLMPEGWQWREQAYKDKIIRWGSAIPDNAEAIVICLPGLGEFCEKYFEFAHDVIAHDMGLAVLDWPGQGLSSRYIDGHPQRRHSDSFMDYVRVLGEEAKRIRGLYPGKPLLMMAHSMGGAIGLMTIRENPDLFSGAFFSAPMVGMKAVSSLPQFISTPIINFFNQTAPRSYAFGQRDWPDSALRRIGHQFLSSDPERGLVHDLWCQDHPVLKVGGVTWGWLYEAHHACMSFEHEPFDLSIPVGCALAGKDLLVENQAARRIFSVIGDKKLLELRDCMHEILMERDEVRDQAMQAFFNLAKDVIKKHKNSLK